MGTRRPIRTRDEIPRGKSVLFDLSSRQLLDICGAELPDRYRRSLGRFKYGPGVFKIDYALSEPVPWTNEAARRAGSLHPGGTLTEIAAGEAAGSAGRHAERPFIRVGQPRRPAPPRAPARPTPPCA